MTIDREQLLERFRAYVADEVLDGKDVGLTYETPLLEWGVLNSYEIVELLSFIRDEFGVEVPASGVVAAHFKDIHALADLVLSLRAGA